MKNTLPILILASLPLSACAMQEGDFPSLAKRPYENAAANAEPLPPPPPLITALPAPLQAAVDKAVAQSGAAHTKFLRNLPVTKRRVAAARGSAVSSEAWVVAQMDLAALEMDRSPSVDAMADIDALYIARLDEEYQGKPAGGAVIIARSRKQIEAQVKQQQDEIDAMKGRLR